MSAQEIVQNLMANGMSAMDIAKALNHRVSARTVYRWAKGGKVQQPADEIELKNIHTKAIQCST